jgi:hypothetical protein
MKGKLIKENNGYTLFVDGKVFGDTDGHQLKSITNRLSIKNCQIIELDCDLDGIKRKVFDGFDGQPDSFTIAAVERTIQIMVELMGDKKFSKDDMRKAIEIARKGSIQEQHNGYGMSTGSIFVLDNLSCDEIIHSLQQTEWDVEVEMVKEHIGSRCYKKYPKSDDEGCLILKKI